MFKFDWDTVLKDEIVDSIVACVNDVRPTTRDQVREQLLIILRNEGGFPITEVELDSEAFTNVVYGVLDDALRRAFATELAQAEWPGFELSAGEDGVHSRVTARSRISINAVGSDILETLPGVGSTLAAAIVEDRRKRGPFRHKKDLARRIDGIGEQKADHINVLVHYEAPLGYDRPEPGAVNALRHLLSRAGIDQERWLVELLEVASVTSARRSPERWFGIRIHEGESARPMFLATTTEILHGSSYYGRVRELLIGAQSSILVAMFHIALPRGDHPTKGLLDALIEAKNNNIEVRVLLDQDRPKDPYGSTVINRRAIKYLTDADVDVRVDSSDKLLHSKIIVIDKKQVVIGSHNWSAGSYYHFDDLSVLLHCEEAGQSMATRFELMWSEASAP